ncbi:MAG: helix-turn-helix domain-containing protein, partial [Lachnospiraceae bacterium]|nr:helix-turn-helix domain-containing protein [Lachnospiraceae bacterium]
ENHPEGSWAVPYLPIDPKDVGRTYDSDVIRINSQSGKGGVGYILKQNYGITIPDKMKEEVGYTVKGVSDHRHMELSPQLVYQIFEEHYVSHTPYFHVTECHFKQKNGIVATAVLEHGGQRRDIAGNGNGRLDAVSNALKQYFNISYELSVYEEHSLSRGSSAKAVSYVGISCNNRLYWGVGIDEDIIKSSIEALCVAVNKLEPIQQTEQCRDERLNQIMNYIQEHYLTVTLDELTEKMHLSKPYLSKYIKEKSGKTFGDIVKNVRMKKARTLLKNTSMTVENIADSVGYQNVEHFNRLFKKKYGMTPVQFRNSRQGGKNFE